jgi:hypothetical protein
MTKTTEYKEEYQQELDLVDIWDEMTEEEQDQYILDNA